MQDFLKSFKREKFSARNNLFRRVKRGKKDIIDKSANGKISNMGIIRLMREPNYLNTFMNEFLEREGYTVGFFLDLVDKGKPGKGGRSKAKQSANQKKRDTSESEADNDVDLEGLTKDEVMDRLMDIDEKKSSGKKSTGKKSSRKK